MESIVICTLCAISMALIVTMVVNLARTRRCPTCGCKLQYANYSKKGKEISSLVCPCCHYELILNEE